jgi:hypothetical protein
VKKKNPLLQKKWWDGYNQGFGSGFEEARDTAVAHFATRLDRIGLLKGIGPKTMQKIIQEMERPLSPEENKQAEAAVIEMRQQREAKKRVSS